MSELGIVIVNYNSTDFLELCVRRIYEQTLETSFHVVVVDNASADRDFSGIASYPRLDILQNSSNLGFATGCNQGVRHRPAAYYLFLNPDCMVKDGAIDSCVSFMRGNPRIGIVGCRVTNPDGSLQLACRRKIPRPSTAFYRFTGLSRLFPHNPRFAAYNLSHMEDDSEHEVEAVSGSFLLFRQEVLNTAGYMDEQFFLYGEDLDFCYRAAQRGWLIYYYPNATVIHHKRVSSSRNPTLSNFHFYDAMKIFYRKHYGGQACWLERKIVVAGIELLHLISRVRLALSPRKEVGSRR